MFGAVCFHTALFASEPETVIKTTCVLEVIHSLVHPINCTRVRLEADRDHLFSWVLVRLFDPHPSAIAVFTPAQKIHTKGENELEFDLIEPNKTGVNTPLKSQLQERVTLYSISKCTQCVDMFDMHDMFAS